MSLSPGIRIGPYVVVAPLGAGGMGEVYRARDSRLKRDVALKVLPEDVANDPERLARFQREAEVLASLNHANVAHVYGVEDRALVMELVEGEDLSQRIARGPIPIDEALPIARQIAEAVDAAHEAGIVHRDLKPANVKVRPDGTVKVLDFGLAKAFDTGVAQRNPMSPADVSTLTSPATTERGVILGTPAYMAPEQAKGQPVDKRADIWAFGCVLHEMVTGRRPFESEDGSAPDLTLVPTRLRRLLQRCLQKDPRRRLRDIGDVWTLIDDEVAPAATRPERGWHTVAASAIAVVATVVASVLAYMHWREQPPAAPPIARLHIALPPGAAPDLDLQVSPDGRRLAYLGRGSDGVLRVFLRALDELDARAQPGTENVGPGSLFWSSDSRWLVFSNQGRLKKLDAVDGGAIQTIADVTGSGVVGGTWNRDGTILIGTNPGPRPGSGGLFKVVADGPITPVTVIDANRQEVGHRFPTFLPDGRRFLYLRTSYDPMQSGIYVGDIDKAPDAQSLTRVIATPIGPVVWLPAASGESPSAGRLLFHRENNLLVQPFDLQTLQLTGAPRSVAGPVGTFIDRGMFSATPGTLVYTTATGALDVALRWHDASSGTADADTGVAGAFTHLRLSPDGTRAVAASSEFDSSHSATLWLLDFARKTRTRLTFGPGRHRAPIWSPDGKAIVYVNDRADGRTMYRKRLSGETNDEVLLEQREVITPNSYSQDGRLVLFDVSNATTRIDLWALPLDGNRKPYPVIATPLTQRDAQLSPDGRWLAYVEQDLTQQRDVFVRPFSPPGAPATDVKWQVSTGGGDYPQWLRGGRQLSYVTAGREDDRHIMVVDIVASSAAASGGGFQWDAPRRLLSLPRGTTLFALADEGRRVLAATPRETNVAPKPLTVILNWLDGSSPPAAGGS